MRTVRATLFGASLLVAACGTSATDSRSNSSTPFTTPAPDGGATADLVITRDVDIAGLTTADVFAPDGAEQAPVVVIFHGSEGLRSNMEQLAADVARSGAVVVLPSWPVVLERPPADTTEDVYFEQTAAAVCAVRFARSNAAAYGGTPDDLTVVGHSGGAPLGARVALVEEPPWPGIDCYPGISSHVDRFVGTAGDLDGNTQFANWIPDVYRPYDVFELDVTNRDLEVRLVHGGADTNVWVGISTEFDHHLDAVGIDSEVVYIDAAHGDLIEPSTPPGRLVADQIGALVHGRTSMFDDSAARATMTFDGDRCSFDGEETTPLDQPLRIRLVADADVSTWFSMVGYEPGITDAEMASILAADPLSIDEPPKAPIAANFVSVDPGSEGEMTWVFVDDSLRWVSYCMPEASSPHPGAGMMYPASEVVLVP